MRYPDLTYASPDRPPRGAEEGSRFSCALNGVMPLRPSLPRCSTAPLMALGSPARYGVPSTILLANRPPPSFQVRARNIRHLELAVWAPVGPVEGHEGATP